MFGSTDLDRFRLLESERSLAGARAVAYLAIIGALVFSTAWIGWLPLVPFVALASVHLLVGRLGNHSRAPHVVSALALGFNYVMVGALVALSGGVHSPLLALPAVSIASVGARYGARALSMWTVVAAISVMVGCLVSSLDELVAYPAPLFGALAVLVGVAAFSSTAARNEIRFRERSRVDPLTGLLTRGGLKEELRQAGLGLGDESACCVLIGDLDGFKAVNDRLGHGCGDNVLRTVADVLRKALRSGDLAVRMGGDEFLMVLHGTGAEGGSALAERVRLGVREAVGEFGVTMSIGLAAASGTRMQLDEIFEAADAALYRAKETGRNRTVRAPGGLSSRRGSERP